MESLFKWKLMEHDCFANSAVAGIIEKLFSGVYVWQS